MLASLVKKKVFSVTFYSSPNIYALLTKREVKMAFFFFGVYGHQVRFGP